MESYTLYILGNTLFVSPLKAQNKRAHTLYDFKIILLFLITLIK